MYRTLLVLLTFAATAGAQVTHYTVKLTPDFEHNLLRGAETVEFYHDAGNAKWQKQRGMQIISVNVTGGEATVTDEAVTVGLHSVGKHLLRVEYTAAAGRGITWFTDKMGFDTAFYCEAWMVCDNSPAQRATLILELILPMSGGFNAAGPGLLKKQWQDKQSEHFVFNQSRPVQTYLFSFGVAKLNRTVQGRFVLYAPDSGAHKVAFGKTSDAYAFLRKKATVDFIDEGYTQAFFPDSIAQESGGLALMSADYLTNLEEKDRVATMAHELAHQWWGALVGIRSWSDFWLNEGMADFMTAAFLGHYQGREAYDQQMAANRQRMEELREQGKDRPLHWEHWKDAHEALGPLPYVKGALFLDRLRNELGDDKFWRGIALYTSQNAHRLVDSRDFERAMEEASGRDLKALFDEAVYH
jgi:aminopeptidase N